MKRSDSRRPLSRSSLSLDLPSRLALVVSAAGEHRVSLVPNGPFFACHALRPGRLLHASPLTASRILGSDDRTSCPPASDGFEAELLKRGATPACGSRISLCTPPTGRSAPPPSLAADACPSRRQHSGSVGWLDLPSSSFVLNSSSFPPDQRDLHPPDRSTSPLRTLSRHDSVCLARLQRRQVARTQAAEGCGGKGMLKPLTKRVMARSSRSPWSFGVVLTQSALAVPRLRSDYAFTSIRGLLHPASRDQRPEDPLHT